MFDQSKPAFASLGVLGGSGAVLLGIGQMLGWAISPADAADLSEALVGVAVSVSGAVAVWGRIRAKKRVALR